jgi:hypothetical protein
MSCTEAFILCPSNTSFFGLLTLVALFLDRDITNKCALADANGRNGPPGGYALIRNPVFENRKPGVRENVTFVSLNKPI